MSPCTHRDQVAVTELPESVAGCEDCLAAGGAWVHLRICLVCGTRPINDPGLALAGWLLSVN